MRPLSRTGLVMLSLLSLSLVACGSRAEGKGETQGIIVVTTIYPLQFFASEIGGDRVRVTNLVPPGVEAHDWEPTPQDISAIGKARLFIYNGAGFEPWVDRTLASVGNLSLVVVNTSRDSTALEEATLGDRQGVADPHFWLDPVLAQHQARLIAVGLMTVDQAHSEFYLERWQRLLEKLEALDTAFAKGLSACQRRVVITSHGFMSYLARRYSFEALSVAGVSPDQEPGPARMAELARLAKENGIRHIFFEPLVSPTLAQVLAQEVGAQTLVFNPLEGLTTEQLGSGMNYLTVMQANLDNLRLAMGCGTP